MLKSSMSISEDRGYNFRISRNSRPHESNVITCIVLLPQFFDFGRVNAPDAAVVTIASRHSVIAPVASKRAEPRALNCRRRCGPSSRSGVGHEPSTAGRQGKDQAKHSQRRTHLRNDLQRLPQPQLQSARLKAPLCFSGGSLR